MPSVVDLLGKPWELIQKWFPTPVVPAATAVISLSTWLFLSPSRLQHWGLSEVSNQRRPLLCLLVGASLLLCIGVKWGLLQLRVLSPEYRKNAALKRCIKRASPQAQQFIRTIHDAEAEWLYVRKMPPYAHDLIKNKILAYQIGNRRNPRTSVCLTELAQTVLYQHPELLSHTSSLPSPDIEFPEWPDY